MRFTIVDGQTVFDVAIIYFGRAELAYDFCYYHNLSISAPLTPVDVLLEDYGVQLIPDESADKVNKQVAKFFSNQKNKPATLTQKSKLSELER